MFRSQIASSDDNVGIIDHLRGAEGGLKDLAQGHSARENETVIYAHLTRMWLDFLLLNEANMCAGIRSGFAIQPCATSARRFADNGMMYAVYTDSDRRKQKSGKARAAAKTDPINYPVCDHWTTAHHEVPIPPV